MADNFLPVQAQDFTLAGSGITLGVTSITLKTFAQIDGTLLTMADFGDTGYMVLEPNTAREENISFTGVTQNANGTATLTGVTRGLKFVSPYTADNALRHGHAGGTIARLSNTAPFYNEISGKDNDETISGVWTFTDPNVPRMNVEHTYGVGEEKWFATKKYVDDTASFGAPFANTTTAGIVEEATVAEIGAGTGTGGTGARLFINPTSVAETGPAANYIPHARGSDGLLDDSWGGGANSLATLNGSSKVVEDPANASTTPGVSKIPISEATGKIADGWLGLTTAGDIVYSDGADLQRLAVGTAGQVLKVNSGATAPQWKAPSKININTTAVSFSDSDAENTLYSTTITGGLLGTNNGIRLRAFVSFSNGAAGAETVTLNVKYGGTTIATWTSAAVAQINTGIIVETMLFADGATNAQESSTLLSLSNSSYNSPSQSNVVASGTAAIDSTANQTLTITAQWSTNATNTSTFSNAVVTLID